MFLTVCCYHLQNNYITTIAMSAVYRAYSILRTFIRRDYLSSSDRYSF